MCETESFLDNLPLIQLVKEAAQMKEMMYKLINSDNEIIGLVSNSMIPFLAFVCDGIIAVIPEETDLSENDLGLDNKEFRKLVSKIRVGHKLFSDKKISRLVKLLNEKQIENIGFLTSNYNALQQTVINVTGQKDYGVFSFDDIDFFNNMQGYIYLDFLFTDKKDITHEDLEGFVGLKLKGLGSSLASLLSSFVSGFESTWGLTIDKESKIEVDAKKFKTKDFFLFDGSRKNIFNDRLSNELQILLHSNLCQLNFISSVIPVVFRNQSDIYIRFVLITFLESTKILKELVNQKDILEDRQVIEINHILNSSVYALLSKDSVRNNIAHYKLEDYDLKHFDGQNILVNIIEIEEQRKIAFFWKDFTEEFNKLKLVLTQLIY